MENKNIPQPNFMVLQQRNNKGPIYKVTICKHSLNVLDEEVISGIPDGWSVEDFFELMDEGKRFFSNLSTGTSDYIPR